MSDRTSELESHFGESPNHVSLGLTLSFAEPGIAIINYDGRREATNRRGNASGGAIAQMIDSAVMQSVGSLLAAEDFITTLEIKVNFLRPAPPGGALSARGRVEHLGRTTAVGTAAVMDSSNQLIAIGTATISVRRSE